MKCPNCGGEIGRFELDPNCKHCGVNIFYYTQNTMLARDAKRCELENASLRIFVSKLKTAFIKGALPISRIVFSVLTLCAILVPFADAKLTMPVVSKSLSFGGIGLYQAFSDGTLSAVLAFRECADIDVFFIKALLLVLAMVLIVLAGAAILVTEILSFINIQKTARIMRTVSVLGMVFSVFGAVMSFVLGNSADVSIIKTTFGFGAFVALAMFIADFVINNLFIKRKIQHVAKEVDLQRIAMRKRVKAGEISLDDLPLPVFESDEEREKRLADEQKREALAEEAKGGEHRG